MRGGGGAGAVFRAMVETIREATDFSKKIGILKIEHFLHVCWPGGQWSRSLADFSENSTARRHARTCTSSSTVLNLVLEY
jgi:hypothetical protein